MDEPNNSDWAALYEAAIKFKEASPWRWIASDELFAIENPENAAVAYCTVLGGRGEEFGMGIYMGDEGYRTFTRLLAEEVEPGDFLEIMKTPLISMLLVDRGTLDKRDLDVIHSLGLHSRGKSGWPFFRSKHPGSIPWFLERNEALFLTTIIQQALILADRVRLDGLDLLKEEKRGRVLSRYRRDGEWQEKWQKPKQSGVRTRTDALDPVNEARLHLLSTRAGKASGSCDLDVFTLPVGIRSQTERPYLPLCFMVVERKQGLIVGSDITEPWLTLGDKQVELIEILSKVDPLPCEIWVRSKRMMEMLGPITRPLGINLRMGPQPKLEKAKANLCNRFSKRSRRGL